MNITPRRIAIMVPVLITLVGCQTASPTPSAGDEALDKTLALMVEVDHMTDAKRYDWCMEYMPRLWVDAPFTLESGCEHVSEDWPESKAEIVALSLLYEM